MNCPSCGKPLSRLTKYCSRCGSQILSAQETTARERAEKRFDNYLEGLFWTAVFGLGTMIGGSLLIKNALGLGGGFLIGFIVIGATAFTIVFGLHLWEIFRLRRLIEGMPGTAPSEELDTNELAPAKEPAALAAESSVVEEVTRAFEQRRKEESLR